jgi:hypothetical protein
MRVVRSRFGGLLAVAAAVAAAGCERADTRLEHLTVGIAKDSVARVMGANPKRSDPYLTRGKYIEAMYFPRANRSGPEAEMDRNMEPVIVIDGKLAGWGWSYWDSLAAAHKIPVAPKR